MTEKGDLDRRSLLALAGAAAATATVESAGLTEAAAAQSMRSDIVLMNGFELSNAIKTKRVSCVEVMNAYLDHIARLNPKVNAIVSMRDRGDLLRDSRERDAQLARGEYLGWMHGFPQAIKDLAAGKGMRMTMG